MVDRGKNEDEEDGKDECEGEEEGHERGSKNLNEQESIPSKSRRSRKKAIDFCVTARRATSAVLRLGRSFTIGDVVTDDRKRVVAVLYLRSACVVVGVRIVVVVVAVALRAAQHYMQQYGIILASAMFECHCHCHWCWCMQ